MGICRTYTYGTRTVGVLPASYLTLGTTRPATRILLYMVMTYTALSVRAVTAWALFFRYSLGSGALSFLVSSFLFTFVSQIQLSFPSHLRHRK